MKNLPTIVLRVIVLVAAGAACTITLAAGGETIASTAMRQQTLDNAKKLMAPREILPVVANPFYSGAEAPIHDTKNPDQPRTGLRTDRELLQAIALSLKPTGFFVLGGQPTLVFGQKRVKAGSSLTITFEGAEYTLEITAVDRINFTLRLNREEFTRTNK